MSKQLRFNFEDKEYILEYTRKSVEVMERAGFKASEFMDKPMTYLPMLFAGAFRAHHPSVKQEVIDRIFAKLKNKGELLNKLTDMYNDPIMALMEEPDEGNVEWTTSW